MDPGKLALLGTALVFVGFFVVFAGVVTGSGGGSSSSAGGFILIGPIPIVFGNGPDSSRLALLGIAITVVVVVVYLLAFLRWRSSARRTYPDQ